MLSFLRSQAIAGLAGLSLLALASPAARADGPTWGRLQTAGGSSDSSAFKTAYYYNNAPATSVGPSGPSLPALAGGGANSNSVTYRSYGPDPGANPGSYYYVPGPCACYGYVPGPTPAVVRNPATSATGPATTTANATSGSYRSFAPDTGAGANYAYSPGADAGAYASPSARSGRSWSGRR